MIFFRISRQIPEKSDAFCFFNQICENKLESCQKFWNLWELFTIIQNYSLVSSILGQPAQQVPLRLPALRGHGIPHGPRRLHLEDAGDELPLQHVHR